MGLDIVGVIGVVALVGGVVLAWFISTAAERRVKAAATVISFALAVISVFVAQALVALLGATPAVIVALIAALLAAAFLFFLAGRQVKWSLTRVLALLGIVLMCMMLTFAVGMAFGDRLAPMRAERLAKGEGLDVLLPGWLPAMRDVEGLTNVPPGDAKISLTWVEEVPTPDAGIWLGYNGLDIYERKTGTGLSLTKLERKLPAGAVRTQTTVKGQPALLVEYKDDRATVSPSGQVLALFFEMDGVTVNMKGLSKEQIVKVAESLDTQ